MNDFIIIKNLLISQVFLKTKQILIKLSNYTYYNEIIFSEILTYLFNYNIVLSGSRRR